MASAAEQLAANLNFSALAKAEELKKRIWFTLGALLIYRLGTYIPLARHRSCRLGAGLQQAGRRHPRHVQHVRGRRHPPDGDLRPQHHAIYLGLDHRPADDDGLAHARAAQEGGRAGPQGDQPVHPLRHGVPGGAASLWHLGRAAGRGVGRRRARHLLQHLHRDHADRRGPCS